MSARSDLRMTADGADLEALLEQVLERLDRIEALLLASGRGPRDRADAAVLPAIGAAVEGRAFSSRELLRHAAVDPELAAALLAADIVEARGLGWLLRRLEGQDIDGWRLARVGSDRDGIIWQVRVSRV